MKIDNAMQIEWCRELMGAEASREEASAMIDVLRHSGFKDTDDIPEHQWLELCELAVAENLRPYLP